MATKRDREIDSDKRMLSRKQKKFVDYVDVSGHILEI